MKNPYPPLFPTSLRTSPGRVNLLTLMSWWACFGLMLLIVLRPVAAQTTAAQLAPETWQPGQLSVPTTQSDPHNEVQKLLRQAKYTQSMVLVDKYLTANPNDPQMLFWRGFLFERTGNSAMALEVYLTLTQSYPELPEPHNNLGVLYAAQGDYDKARASFEAALRSNPNYATAYENMGDLMVAMAKLSYQRSGQLNGKNALVIKKIDALKPTLQLIENKP